jgi:hypothetical protein
MAIGTPWGLDSPRLSAGRALSLRERKFALGLEQGPVPL